MMDSSVLTKRVTHERLPRSSTGPSMSSDLGEGGREGGREGETRERGKREKRDERNRREEREKKGKERECEGRFNYDSSVPESNTNGKKKKLIYMFIYIYKCLRSHFVLHGHFSLRI